MKCTQCNERNGNTRCEGCHTLFCLPCMNKHHDELVQRFQLVMDLRNEMKQSLDVNRSLPADENQTSCLLEIDQWERDLIQRIQEVATKARTNVKETMLKHMNRISDRFEQLSLSMQEQQKEGNYLENDIEKVKEQLDELKNDIEQVNENIRVNCTLSNSIEWDRFIDIIDEELPNKVTFQLGQTEEKIAKTKLQSTMKMTGETSEPTSIPIHWTKSNSPSTNATSNESHERAHQPGTCIRCQRLAYDLSQMGICSECDRQVRISTSQHTVKVQPQPQTTRLPVYDHDSTIVLLPTLNTNNLLPIYCPHCKVINYLSSEMGNFDYYCVVCRNQIPMPNYQK